LQQKQFGEAVQQPRPSSYADIEHEVKEWIKLAADSDGGFHQEDRRASAPQSFTDTDRQLNH